MWKVGSHFVKRCQASEERCEAESEMRQET